MAHTPGDGHDAAHDGLNDDGEALTGTLLDAETGHTHTAAPTVSSVTAVDTKGAVVAAGDLVSNVDGKNIVLVNDLTAGDDTRVVIALTDHDTSDTTPEQLAAGAFQLKITFNQDVYPVGAAGTTAGVAPEIEDSTGVFTGVTFLASTKDGVDVSSQFTLGTLTRVQTAGADTTDDVFSSREFLVPVTVTTGLTELQLPISIWVTVGANQVYSLTTIAGGNTIQGRGNLEDSTDGADPFSLNGYVAPTTPPTPDDTAGPDILSFTSSEADGIVTFTITFDEALGTSGLVEQDLEITGGELVATDPITPAGSATEYMIKITPDDDPEEAEVTVRLRDRSVSDKVDGARYVEPMTGAMIGRYDTVNPTVHAVATGTIDANGAGTLSITFSEALGDNTFGNDDIDKTNSNVLLTNSPPARATTQPEDGTEVWEIMVHSLPSTATQAILVIDAGSVSDMAGNELLQDTIVTWTRADDTEADKPVVAIALAGGMTYIDSVSGGNVEITATDNVAVTDAVEADDITVTNGVKGAFANNLLMVTPNVAQTTVTVTVAANAAMDAAGNGNAEVSETFNVGPVFTIPAKTILVVTKTAGMTSSYVSDQPRLPVNQQPPTPAADFQTAVWSNMPDLEVLFSFDRGGNGGTLNLTEAAGQEELGQTRDGGDGQHESVRISEVMWASDLSLRGSVNDAEASEQWIEITNNTAAEVNTFLFARTGRDSAINVDDVEDRVGNAYDGSIGNAGWTVPGQNGNSWTGEDFVSMHRKWDGDKNRGYVNGMSKGNWSASGNVYLTLATRNLNDGSLYNHKGSPGRRDSVSLPKPSTRAGITNVPSSPVVINEVANRSESKYEWIELRNVTDNEVNLRNWMISVVRATDDDKPMIQFPNNDNAKIAPKGVILLLASDPRFDDEHPIAVGYNVDVNENDQADGLGLNVEGSNRQPPRQKIIDFANDGLPDDGNFILILRKHDNYEGHRSGADGGKGVAETGGADIDKIIDVAGHHEGLDKSNYPGTTPEGLNKTTLWPLVNFSGHNKPHRGHGDWNHRRHNRLGLNRVRYRQHDKTSARNDADGSDGVNRAGTGSTHKDEGVGHYAFRDAIYTGLGYKRTARVTGYNNGTPGYNGNSVGNTGVVKATSADAMVTISEIMYSTGPDADNPVYPQWIELYNSSPTNAVNLRDWKLRFEMLDADGNPMDSLTDLSFNSSRSVKTILPQQTVLIVAGNARQANSDSATGGDVFNENRVFNVFRDIGAGKFGGDDGTNTRYMFFNPEAFNISIVDKDGKTVDSVGNLDGDDRTSDTNNWELPTGIAADGNRTSIIRVYDDGVARSGVNVEESHVMPVFGTGDKELKGNNGVDEKWSWIPASNTEREFKITIKSTWFGDEDDYGTPNNRPGMVLPVELSHFRPTLEDGVVTIRWTTESELDNAGFNILRSDARDGQYKQVNAELIEGAGTTGERNTYKWVDQTAKPGVVYYYQIEDVSFAGEHQALAITKLKGLISAKNKLTTTWSELKASQ